MLLAVLIGAPFFLRAAQVSAGAVSWMESDPVLTSTRPLDPAKDPNAIVRGDCVLETVEVLKTYHESRPTRNAVLCLNEVNGWRFGQENVPYGGVYASNGGLFYKVRNLSAVHHFKGTDTIIAVYRGHAFGYDEISHLKKYDNFTKRLRLNEDKKSFEFDQTSPLFSLERNGKPSYAISWGVSNNGRYLVYSHSARNVNAYDIFSRVDMETGEQKVFGRGYYEHTHNREPQPGVVVSNDGEQVVISGVASFKVWRLSPDCLIDYEQMKDEFRDPCLTRTITPTFYDEKWKGLEASHERLRVNDAFTELTYQHRALRGGPPSEVVTISIAKQEPETPRLDYLALGDSYSSGEGDIYQGEAKNYIKDSGGVDECHLSNRSYPFILAGYWNVKNGRAQSVACSGARVAHDYIAHLAHYPGQSKSAKSKIGDPRNRREEVVQLSLENFLPGYVPQIEFVKKYKPKVITLTGGGNDVGFGEILSACNEIAIPRLNTCSYATSGRVKQLLKDSIYNQYGLTRLLIRRIKEASPDSKLYIIGYPQFIDKRPLPCALDGGLLNPLERAAIVDMTSEMNGVLWRAATDSGVPFVDISNSLSGGKLCAGGKYMTGLHDIAISQLKRDKQNLYHPNSAGHLQIARSIFDKIGEPEKTFIGDSVPTAKSSATYQSAPIVHRALNLAESDVEQEGVLNIALASGQLKPMSATKITLHSDPASLGEYQSDERGILKLSLTVPRGVRPGTHTLLIEGVSVDGKKVSYYDFVTVKPKARLAVVSGREFANSPGVHRSEKMYGVSHSGVFMVQGGQFLVLAVGFIIISAGVVYVRRNIFTKK